MVFILQVWRDFQFQHLYNLAQQLMLKTGRDSTFYVGAVYLDSSLRNFGISEQVMDAMVRSRLTVDAVVMTQSNFRAADKLVERCFKKAQIVDSLKYDDETLILDSEKCFQLLKRLDGIRFYADFCC